MDFFLIEGLIDLFNSCSNIIDSKLIGLTIFMISNYVTGILNLVFYLRSFSDSKAFFTVCFNSFIFSYSAYFLYLRYLKKN